MRKRANAGIGVMVLVVLVAAGIGLFAKFSAQPGMASVTGAAIYDIPAFCSNPGTDDYIGCVDLNADGKVNYSDEEIFSQILDLIITDPEILVYADFDGNGLVDNLIDFQECFVPLRDFYQDKYDGDVSCNTQVGENEFGAPDRTGCTDGCPDLNSDGYVSRDDLNLLRALKNKSISMNNYLMADLTGGGNVTQEDLDCWQVFRYTYVTCNLPVHANHTNNEVCADFRNEYGTGNDVIVNDTDKEIFDAYKETQNLAANFNGDSKINWLDKFIFNEYYDNGKVGCDIYHAPWHTGGIDQNMSEGGADSMATIQSYYSNTQSFNVSREGFLTKVRVRLVKNTVNSLTTNLSVVIWNSTGSPATTPNPMHVLAETVYNDFETNISFPGEWVTIPFVKPPYVEQNKTYHISIKTTNSGEYNWTSKSGNPYSEGEAWTNISGSWTQASNTDMYFYAYTTTACADMNADGIVDSDDEDLIDTIPDGITPTGSENWNSSYDLNNDSIIDEADSSLVSAADGNEKAFVDQQTSGSPGTSKNLGHNLSLAQPFTSSSLVELKYINLSIARGVSGSSNLLVEIRVYDDDTGPDMDSSALASKTISSITNTKFNWTLVEFSSTAFLTAGTSYAIVVSADKTSAGSTKIYNWSQCSGYSENSGTLFYNSSSAEYKWTAGVTPLCFRTYTGNTFDFNDTLDVNNDSVINGTDSALVIAVNGSYGPSYWTPLVDFNAKFEVYEKSLDKGLGFDAYLGQIETCGFPYYLKHECGDLRCSMEYPYSETYATCPKDCSSCNHDSFCAISEDQGNCADCTSIAAGVEYSRFLCDTTKFDDLTDLDSLTNVVIELCNYGKIFYPGPVNFTGVNLDDYVNITQNNISINVVGLPQLNKTATLTFYNLDYTYPIATKNGNLCEGNGCTFISYEGGTLTYSVSGFDENDVTAYSSMDVAPLFNNYNQTLSTNFTRYMEISDITAVNNAEFWKSGIGYVKFLVPVNFTNMSVDDNVVLGHNYVELEITSEPRLNKSYEAGLYNLNMIYPIIETEGVRCEGSSCAFNSYYPNDYLKFTITQASDGGTSAAEYAPNTSKFNGETTNFTRGLGDFTGDIENAAGIVFEILPYGRVEYTQSVNVSKLNATLYLNITESRVSFDFASEPRLNKSANITFYNLSYTYPEVYLNGAKCSTCEIKSFDSQNNFIVGISNYKHQIPVITAADAAPNVLSFNGNTTNFSRRVLSSVESVGNVVLEILPYRKIEFSGNVNVTNTNLSWSNSDNINFGTTSIFINSTRMPGLDQSATITLRNLSFYNPVIMTDSGVACPSSVCSVVSYPYSTGNENICSSNCTMVFSVSDFRYNKYLVVENTTFPQFVNGPIAEIIWRESRNYTFEDIGHYFFDADNATLIYSVINLSCKDMSFNISHSASSQIDLKLIPDLNWFGQCGIRLNVSDGNETIWSNIIVLTVKADLAPVFSGPIPAQTWNEDNNLTINFTDYFSDPEGDDINFTYQFVGAIKDSNITVIIDNVTDRATLIPAKDWNGARYIIFTAHDYKLATSSNYVALTINPVNDAPVCNYTYNILQDEDTNISFDIGGYCADVDDDLTNLNISLASRPTNFNVTYYSNRTIFFVPTRHWNGYESFIVNVTDAGGLSTQTNEFVISLNQVADSVIVVSPTLNITIKRDTNYTFNASNYVYDPDNGAVYYYTQPSNSNIAIELNIITGEAKIIPDTWWYGSEWINLTAEDESSSGTVAINITVVKNVSYTPYLRYTIPNITWGEDSSTSINLYDYFDDMIMTFTVTSTPNITIETGKDWGAVGGGMNDTVKALVVYDGDLYAGGWFTSAGGVSANRIAKWNSTSWSAIGSGMNSFINSLAVYDGDLYAGGSFTSAGGVSVNRTAKWDGSDWSSVGSGMNGAVEALVVYDGDLYAGGSFTSAGGVSVNRTAKWDGSDWSAMGSGIIGDVLSLVVYDGDLYTGGEFTSAGGVSANNTAKWNGSDWSAMGDGVNSDVYSLVVYDGDLYAGGIFTSAGGVSANYTAKWDGSDWSAIGSGMNNAVEALVVYDSDLYAGGYFTSAGGVSVNRTAKWDGSDWSAVGGGTSTIVHSLAVHDSDLYVGGEFDSAGGNSANKIARYSSRSGLATMNPNANFTGVNYVTFTATNVLGTAESNNVTLTITAVNDPPYLIKNIPTQYMVKNNNGTLNLSYYFVDVDGEDLNFTATALDNFTFHIDNNTGIVIIEPQEDYIGTNYTNITAIDESGTSKTVVVTLTVLVGNSTIMNSLIDGHYYNGSYGIIINDSTIVTSNITDSTILNSTIDTGNITNSTVSGSTLTNCIVINSHVVNYEASDCYIENSNIDLSVSGGLSTTGVSGITFSANSARIMDGSEVTSSNVDYSNITNSTVDYSNLTTCAIADAWVRKTNGTNCNVTGWTFHAGSLTYPNGTIAIPTQSLWFVLNYPPEVSFTSVSSGLNFNFISSVSDLNVDASAINDSLTYNWDFGDSITNTSNTTSLNHTYLSYGSYTVKLTVTDFYGEVANYSQTVSITAPGGGTSSSGGGGGGSSSCNDECIDGAKGCTTENGVVTCGNYDTDSCLEWGNELLCSENTECLGGFCQPKVCIPDWVCNGWTECEAGTQTRPCDDYNDCGIMSGRPATEKDCVMPPPVVEQPIRPPEPVLPPPAPIDEGFELFGVGPWELAIAVLMFTLVLTGSIAVMRTVGKRKSKAMEYTQLASLKTAIQRDIVRGVKETDIRNVLIEQGWADYLVNQALKEINDSMLREPVEKNIMQGFDEANLRDVFVNRGWPKEAVDDTIEDVNLSILQKAIAVNLNKGFKMSKIRKGLVGSGWPDQIVDRAIKEHKK